jgi:hypothetical protein
VNVFPLRKNKKWRRGAQTSNQFKNSFWVHVWDVVGKTWPKYEVNRNTGLGLVSIIYYFLICTSVVYDCVKHLRSVTVQFAQNLTPIVYYGDHLFDGKSPLWNFKKQQVHSIIYNFLICASIVYDCVKLWRSVTDWFGHIITPIVYDGDNSWWQVTIMKFGEKKCKSIQLFIIRLPVHL